MGDVSSIIKILTTAALPVLLAITLHEAAHGFAADRLGDNTARMLGRISLNPLRHIDPVGTILV
ncbi:site-2 protease family protein, partial [Staphylococcus epidermidis]|uniref:site-2 protease family protein n=1 Tax=Staphylococcus epidermidis TaxID=1282 RepID=UPI00273A2BAD